MPEVVKYCLSPMQILDRVENLSHRSLIISSDKKLNKTQGTSHFDNGRLPQRITLFMFSPNCHCFSHIVGLP